MEAVRIDIQAYTASFRVPGMMGYQVTAPVPPPATIYGLLAAAAGREIPPGETWVAYRFAYDAQAEDLETIIIYEQGGPVWVKSQYAPKTNVVNRQFLFGARLALYLAPGAVADAFLRPRFPLLLGRSQDVATVTAHRRATLELMQEADVSGILLPFPVQDRRLRSRVMSFPTFYGVAPERTPLAVKPFHVLDSLQGTQPVSVPDLLYREAEESLAVPLFDERILRRP
ncbi:MAG TPA: CRISPR-associated protein Cas5 [Chthonomonadaceae bacterium]|jgi:CRISPR-associated protein Cas5t|nr:CRISPR-associated protein Cas5 [Chthonomonadaceae bacterium]